MFVEVDGTRLFVDVEGAGLVPDGASMREKPTLLMLHGGPGFDHSAFKPAFSKLSDIAQVVYYDHRGNGRSGGDDTSTWTLARWGDDVRRLCDVLGIEKPIVCGLSFGGFVAQSYATRHPNHPGKLILISTVPRIDFQAVYDMFETLGGPDVRRVAEEYWTSPTLEGRDLYRKVCVPFYKQRGSDPGMFQRAVIRSDTALHFNGPANEHGRMDFRADLAKVRCPVLLMSGDRDPITPIVFAEELASALPQHLVRFEVFRGCGHDVQAEDPDRAFRLIRNFICAP